MVYVQPRSDGRCTIKHKSKYDRKSQLTMHWVSCSKCGFTLAKGYDLTVSETLSELPQKCPRCKRTIQYWT